MRLILLLLQRHTGCFSSFSMPLHVLACTLLINLVLETAMLGDLPDPHSSFHSALVLLSGLNPQIPTVSNLSFLGYGADTLVLQEKNQESHCKPSESCQQEAPRWTWSPAASNPQCLSAGREMGLRGCAGGTTSEHPECHCQHYGLLHQEGGRREEQEETSAVLTLPNSCPGNTCFSAALPRAAHRRSQR